MDRQTTRNDIDGRANGYGFDLDDPDIGNHVEEIHMAYDRLAEYEDMDERGHLARLPFSFGDHIYEAYESEGKFLEWEVSGFKVAPDAMYIYVGKFGISINAANLGRTVFRTREEAEARLKELQGMDAAVENIKHGKASEPVDLSDFKEEGNG